MGRVCRMKKVSKVGKGKPTAAQIAFIVDQYLVDNGYAETRSAFRDEASAIIPRSMVHEVPKSLLTLSAIVDDYIRMKEQKAALDKERICLERDKTRIRDIFRSMQDLMNLYNTGSIPPSLLSNSISANLSPYDSTYYPFGEPLPSDPYRNA